MPTPKNIFFETYSFLQVLSLSWHIRSAKQVIFCRPGLLPQSTKWKKYLIELLVRFLNPKATIREITIEEITEEIWQLNKQCVVQVESLSDEIMKSPAYQVALKLIKDENILKYFMAILAREIPAQVFFLRMAQKLMARLNEPLYVVSRYADCAHVITKDNRAELPALSLPRSLRVMNRIRLFLSLWGTFLLTLCLPVAYFILYLSNGFRSGRKPTYKLLMPVVWGFFDQDNIRNGIKGDTNDEYFYSNEFHPGEILHTFGAWPITASIRRQYQEIMRERGYAFTDKKKYRLSLQFIKITIDAFGIFFSSFRLFLLVNSTLDGLLINMLPKLTYRYLEKKLEIENIDYHVEVIRDDYNPAHVISTILANQEGKKTVGIQHTASPYDCPQIYFVHVNCYVVYGEFYVTLFTPYWERLKLARIGREKLDAVATVVMDGSLREKIRSRATQLYGTSKHTALVLFPGAAEICLQRQWNEIYRGLCEVRKTDLDVKIYLRFRSIPQLEKYPFLTRLADLSRHDKRFVVDHTNFTTSELMSLSNLTIVPQSSFAFNESIITGAKTFSFEYTGAAKFYFSRYGKGLVLQSAGDILRVFQGLEQDHEDLTCRWDELKANLNYYADGENTRRLREVVLQEAY